MAGEQRFVINVRIIGAVYRETPKLKMFMMSVLWSDETEVIVYRSFKDFKKFHSQLKKKFPLMKPFKKNDRVIPKFKGQTRRSSLQQKGSKRSVLRMKFLESYCDKLLKCDPTVNQSSEVTQFFLPKDHDLQQDFTKNSIMILLSDDLPDGSGGGGKDDGSRQQAGSITQPFVSQTYRCVAAYETKDTKNLPFKVALDENLDVLIKDPAGWWLVENEEKRMAWFPAPYLELLEEEDDDGGGFQLAGDLYCAVTSYSSKKDDEVSVPIGSVVEVLKKSDDGWWLIRFNGTVGYIPSMNLRPYNNPQAGLFRTARNLATSREPKTSRPSSSNEETQPRRNSAGQSRGQHSVPGRLHKARSLDILSETRSEMDSRARSISITSSEVSFFSPQPSISSSESSSPDSNLYDRRSSNISSDSSGAPRVPPRPRTEEILTRCTTMTRKAALATKTRLQINPESSYNR